MKKRIALLLLITLFITTGTVSSEEKFPFLGSILADNVNIRSGESTNYEVLGKLKKGDSVVVEKKSFSWYKIRLPLETKCYISSQFVQMHSGNIGVVSGNRVNIRAGMGKKFSSLGRLKKGTRVLIKGQKNGWYQIEPIEGIYGYISEEFVRYVSNVVPPPYVIREPSRNIYKKKALLKKQQPLGEISKTNKEKLSIPPKVFKEKKEEKIISISGKLEDLGRVYLGFKYIRHKLVVEGKTKYYLEGSYSILDSLVNNKVTVSGKIKKYPQAPFRHPVLTVVKINLVL